MIAAQTETQQQERLIENYMSLPNQVWDGIILHATQVSFFIPVYIFLFYVCCNLIQDLFVVALTAVNTDCLQLALEEGLVCFFIVILDIEVCPVILLVRSIMF